MRLLLLTLTTLLAVLTLAFDPQTPPSAAPAHTHSKRRGVRGGGIRGGGSSSSSRPPPSTLGNSNRGGRTSEGSGLQPAFAGFYAGGSRVPYRSGIPYRGVRPRLLTGAGLGFWVGGPSAWGPYGAYAYTFEEEITFRNSTTGEKETVEVLCLCRRYVECSCAGNDGKAYVKALINRYGDDIGSMVQVTVVNGSHTAVINGTLANGTTASGAAHGGRRSLVETVAWSVGAVAVGWIFALF